MKTQLKPWTVLAGCAHRSNERETINDMILIIDQWAPDKARNLWRELAMLDDSELNADDFEPDLWETILLDVPDYCYLEWIDGELTITPSIIMAEEDPSVKKVNAGSIDYGCAYPGLYLETNDHGNAALIEVDADQRVTELWSVV